METIQTSFDYLLRENPMGETCKDTLRLDFDSKLKLEFHGTKVTSDEGMVAHREINDALALISVVDLEFHGIRTGENTQLNGRSEIQTQNPS